MQGSAGKKSKMGGNKKKFDDDWDSGSRDHSSDRRSNQNKRNQKREQETA